MDEAWEGYSVSMAMRHAPKPTRSAMINLIKHVSDIVDAAKRLETIKEYDLCVDYLLKSNFGGNYTLTDFRIICEGLIKGKNYNRLKIAEFVAAWEKYDEAKTNHAHVRNAQQRQRQEQEASKRAAEMWQHRKRWEEEQAKREPVRPDRVDWMKGASRMTWQERHELQERDRQRRNN